MRKYSVTPADDIGDFGAHAADFPTPSNKLDYEHRQMQGNRLIGYLDFQKVKHGTTRTVPSNSGVTQVQQASGQILVKGDYTVDPSRVKSYFLPWLNNAIISLAIPAYDSTQPLGTNPRYFFTAAINGCSVFVKGTPQSPVVYHAGGNTGTKSPQAGAKVWRDLMQSHNQTQGVLAAEVNKTMYVTDKTNKAKGTQHSREFTQWMESNLGGTYLIEDVAPTGCVMGVREGGAWTFYLQENITVTYSRFTRQVNRFSKDKKIAVNGSQRIDVRPMMFREIFPNGGSNAKMVPVLTRAFKG